MMQDNQVTLLRLVFLLYLSLLAPFLLITVTAADSSPEEPQYYLIGVSGGLQEGFPDHEKLHYQNIQSDEEKDSKSVLLGKAVVRGYKAYLDVMQEGWRQYSPEPEQPLINSVVLASGCHEHANQYWVYIVDARQVLSVLNNEPRFLSITPDTGLIDLTAAETSPAVRHFAREQIRLQGKTDMDRVAIPIVTAVWYHESFVPSPPMKVLEDGTELTNFPESLALWAKVDDEDRTSALACSVAEEGKACASELDRQARYWEGIRKAIRTAEINRPTPQEIKDNGPPFSCKRNARFGVGDGTARINYPFTASELSSRLKAIGLYIDFEAGVLIAETDK